MRMARGRKAQSGKVTISALETSAFTIAFVTVAD